MIPLLPAVLSVTFLAMIVVGVRAIRDPGPFVTSAAAENDTSGTDASSWIVDRWTRLSYLAVPWATRLAGSWYSTRLEQELLRAGSPHGYTVQALMGRKLLTVAGMSLVGVLLATNGYPLFGLLFVVMGLGLHDAWLALLADERQKAIEAELPDLLDVLAVTVAAGTAFRPALARVSSLHEGPLAEEMQTTLQEMEFGLPRRRAFENLRRRNAKSRPLTTLVAGILQAEELGVPIVDAIVDLTQEMRHIEEQRVRRAVSRVEARTTLLLTLTILPGAVVLIGAGLWLSADVDLGVLLGG